MNKRLLYTIIVLIILGILIIGFFLSPKTFIGLSIKNQNIENQEQLHYSYTRAICNSSNFCQDYEIECINKTLITMKPITGAFVQHPEDWTDPRKEESLC